MPDKSCSTLNTRTNLPERITTIVSIERKFCTGYSAASSLLLNQQWSELEWGPFPRSYTTYQQDGFKHISANDFSLAFSKVRSTQLAPSIQWTSTQILLRTIWTRVKEGNSNRRANDDPNAPFDVSCLNCGREPEHTVHIFYKCNLASNIWDRILECTNEIMPQLFANQAPFPIPHTVDRIMFQQLPHSLNQLLA